ncbi:MAG: C10 family peptidase [Bacteroidales bacterium]|nr:C10 family peptidase [Bacteroidales bacterium]
MKKYLFSVLALLLGIGMLHANPVDESVARKVGRQFAQTTMQTRGGDLELVYAPVSERGTAVFYVYNVGQEGYVVVSGDDYYRPIIGYSKSDPFDPTNPGLAYYLRTIQSGRNKLTGTPSPDIAAEWEMVMNEGRLMSKNGGRMVDVLVQTRWNQNYPYNAMCPAFAGGPGGHFYVGCVATAMAQIMKYWNHPLQGQGSHTYTSEAHPYTAQHPVNIPAITSTANFGATTYDWDNMPNSVSSSSPAEQINAVATLSFHCAVAVDMDWDYDGSGSNSQLASQRISQYFRYSNAASYQRRANFSAPVWAQKVKESLDMGWPLLYSGVEEGAPYGHAFVLDGYDDNDMYHFNWGWSGSGDDWFTFETQDYHVGDGAVFNFAPAEVYNNTPQAPTGLSVTPAANNQLSATLTWTNPSKSLNNSNISSIDQIVIMRGGEIIGTIDNPTPGAQMSFVDDQVPCYDIYQYHVYAVVQGAHGKTVHSESVSFGPTCNWTIMMTSSHVQGWRGGSVSIYNAAGSLIKTCTTTNASPSSVMASIPVGRVYFSWNTPTAEVANMNIVIKDSQNNQVYQYAGSSNDLPEGVFFEANNGCGNEPGIGLPTNLLALRDETNPNDILVSWDGVDEEGYGYNIYRDNVLHRTVIDGTSFVDHNVPEGGHCYYAVYLSYGGENEGQSNESCANAGEGCNPPTNLDGEVALVGTQYKVNLRWEKPEVFDGLSGYYIYRKAEGEEYKRIKTTGSSATSYTDGALTAEGVYYYKVVAYYHSIECYSAPAHWIGDDNQFYLSVYWSPTGVEESLAHSIKLFPNPTKDSFTVEGEGLQSVMVYNTVGQLVYSRLCDGDNAVIELGNVESGLYMVKIITANGETTKKLSVTR